MNKETKVTNSILRGATCILAYMTFNCPAVVMARILLMSPTELEHARIPPKVKDE